MKYLLPIVGCLILVGCQRNEIAENTLNTSLQVHTNLTKQYDEAARLTLRAFDTEMRNQLFAQAERDIWKETLSSGVASGEKKYVNVDFVVKMLADLKTKEETAAMVLDNQRDKFGFLQSQSERLHSMMLILDDYIQSQKNPLQIAAEESKKKSTSQPSK